MDIHLIGNKRRMQTCVQVAEWIVSRSLVSLFPSSIPPWVSSIFAIFSPIIFDFYRSFLHNFTASCSHGQLSSPHPENFLVDIGYWSLVPFFFYFYRNPYSFLRHHLYNLFISRLFTFPNTREPLLLGLISLHLSISHYPDLILTILYKKRQQPDKCVIADSRR